MKKIMKTTAVAGFSAWILLSASMLPSFAAEQVAKEGGMFRKHIHRHVGYNASIHQQEYLSYLVKEYAPETKKDWEKAFAERNAVLVDKEQLRAKFQEKQGKMNRQELKNRIGEKVDREKLKEEMDAKRALEDSFAQAVKNHDKKAIKELMPKLLADYKKCTERMSQHFAKMKERIDSLTSKK